MIPEEKFNSRPRGRQMAEICFQKAPGQDLCKDVSMIPEEKLIAGRGAAKWQKFACVGKNGRFPMIPEREIQ